MIDNFQKFLDVLVAFEGIELKAYKDSVGVSTIGIGSTAYPGGNKVKMGDTCTKEQAYQYATVDAKAKLKAIAPLVKVELSENQWVAALCLTYNIGSGGFATSSFLRSINQKANVDLIVNNMKKWNKGKVNGVLVELPGLTDRRQVESEIFTGKLNIEGDATHVVAHRMHELYQARQKK